LWLGLWWFVVSLVILSNKTRGSARDIKTLEGRIPSNRISLLYVWRIFEETRKFLQRWQMGKEKASEVE